MLLAQARVPIAAQAPGAQQRPRLISLDFKDADINNILRILAEFSGLNIVSSDDVKGKVTVKLQNVPWQQALDSVVRAAKLAYVQEGNIIRVDKLENLTKEAEAGFKAEQREVEIQQRRKEADLRLSEQERSAELSRREFEARKQELEIRTAPLVEEIIPLKHAHVGIKRTQVIDFFTDQVATLERKGVEEAITGGAKKEEGKPAGLLSSRGQLTIDMRTNSLIVRDVPDYVAKIKAFVEKVDRPAAAVQIEARIVEVNKEDARRLGVVWGGGFTPRAGANSPIIDFRGSGTPGGSPATAGNFPAPTASAFPAVGNLFGLTVGWLASNLALDLSLQAMEGEGRARILSSPSLMTLDNESATIASGQKIPIISTVVTGGAAQASVSFTDVTTRLQVVPRVLAEDRQIVLNLAVKRETLQELVPGQGLLAPRVSTRSTITQVRIPDGGTVVIGGLRDEQTRSQNEGLPWLKKIPVLGWLFKNDLVEGSRSELIVFLTAKVIENPGQAAVTPDLAPPDPRAPLPPGPTGQAPLPAPAKPPVAAVAGPPASAPRPTYPVSDVGGR